MRSRKVLNLLSVMQQSRRADEYGQADRHGRHCTLAACAVVTILVLGVCSGQLVYGQTEGEPKLKESLPEIFFWTQGDLPARSQITSARRFWIGENHLMKQKPKPGLEAPGFLPDQRFPTYAQFASTLACKPLQSWDSIHAKILTQCRGVAAQEVVLLAGTSESIICRFALVDVRTQKHADVLMKTLLTLRSHAVSTLRNGQADAEKKLASEDARIRNRGPRQLGVRVETPEGTTDLFGDAADQFWGNWNTSSVAAITHGQRSFSYELGDHVVWCRGMSPEIVRQECYIPYLRLVVVRNKTWFVFGLFQFGKAYRDISYEGNAATRNLVPPKKKIPKAMLTAVVNAACRKMKAAMVEYDVPDNIRDSLTELVDRRKVVLSKLKEVNLRIEKMQESIDKTKGPMDDARKCLAKAKAKYDQLLYNVATPGHRDIVDKDTGIWNVNLDPTGGYYSKGAGMSGGRLWESLTPKELNIVTKAGIGGANLMPLMDAKAGMVYWSSAINRQTKAIEADEYRVKKMKQALERAKQVDLRKWTNKLKLIEAEISRARNNQTFHKIPRGNWRADA